MLTAKCATMKMFRPNETMAAVTATNNTSFLTCLTCTLAHYLSSTGTSIIANVIVAQRTFHTVTVFPVGTITDMATHYFSFTIICLLAVTPHANTANVYTSPDQ